MPTDDVISQLNSFEPTDETENICRLYDILGPLDELAPELRAPAIPALLELIERHPEAEFGSPGPLVHTLEKIPGYQPHLQDSVRRRPTELNIWMVNRVLNSTLASDTRSAWLDLLRSVLQHPLASQASRLGAADYLKFQNR